MSKQRVKLLLSAILLAAAVVALWLTLRGLADLVVYFQQGADPASVLNIVPNVPPDLHVQLDWLPDDPDTGRVMEPFTRQQIGAAYLRAWLQWNLSYVKGEPYGLKSYFVGPALLAASEAVTSSAAAGWRVAQADLAHTLKLHFYAADGSIVSFTDSAANVVQVIRDGQGVEVFAGESTAAYDVVMFLEDGNWRVRHWVRVAVEDATEGQAGPVRPLSGEIAGVNYYAQATPWERFWTEYDPAVTDRDFARIRSLGLNSVRIFVPYAIFGGPRVAEPMLARLGDLLDRADAAELGVIVTLFDFWGDYALLGWPAGDRHLDAIVPRFAGHPALLAWDVKNEPDRDYARAGRSTVNAWLAHVVRRVRALDPDRPVTIGWWSPEAAAALAGEVDFVSFHYYAPAAELPQRYAALAAAAAGRPLLLSEFGLPTWNSFFFPNGHSEKEQAQYYADVLGFLRTADSPGFLAWTLYDFPRVPASVVGWLPWRAGPERRLGVIREDGQAKPAARLLAPDAPLDVARVPAWARFLKPFWLTVAAVLLLAAALVRRYVVVLRRRGR